MALKLLAIGCVKSGSRICGYRLIDYNDAINQNSQNYQVKYLDLSSDSIINAMRNNQVIVDNLSITNGELKGSNGQASRYGIVDAKTLKARNQVMVIVAEVKDINGYLVGYICSDTNGSIVRLLADQAITQAGRLGLANGKLVDNGNGGKRISAISGSYSTLKLNYDYKEKSKKPERVSNVQQTNQKSIVDSAKTNDKSANITNNTEKTEKKEMTPPELYNKALETIKELEHYKEFKTDFSYKIASSVKRWHKCSEKQLGVLEKALKSFKDSNAERIETPEQVEKKGKNGWVESTPKPESSPTKEQETQKHEEVDKKPKNENKFAAGIKPVEVENNAEELNGGTQQPKLSIGDGNIDTPQESQEVKNEETSDISNQATDEHKIELCDILNKQVVPRNKTNLPVSDLSIFDFGIINNEIYIRGFKEDVDIPDNIVMPDTVRFNGQDKPVSGLAINAFKDSEIKTVKTGKYIKDIGAGVFYNCRKLEVIDLSASQHSMIPANMAYGCKSLKYAHLGNNIDRVHELAFCGCTSLVSVDANANIETIARQAFAFCERLSKFKAFPKFINEGAFEGCYSLTENGFNFKLTTNIGTKAFRGTGFKELTLPGNIKSIGRKAFADCALLKTVKMEEGVEFIDMYCFAKSIENCGKAISLYTKLGVDTDSVYCDTELVDTPKSLKDVGNDAFRHVLLVMVFTGSASESICIGFNIPYKRKDAMNKDNSTKVRQRSNLLSIDPVEMLHRHLNMTSVGECNPEFNVDTSKFLNAKLTDSHFKTLSFKQPADHAIEPHIKFKAALKYAMDLAEPFTLPLTPAVLRFSSIIKIETTELFGDGWNEIYKTTFFKRDTLESGSFITFMQGDTLIYIVEAASALDIELTPDAYCDSKIPIKDHLHAGDKIGNDSTIDGRNAAKYIYEAEGGYRRSANVGLDFFNRIKQNSIIIKATRTTYVYYVPATGFALVLFDSRKEKDDSVYRNNNKYAYFTVIKILDYNQLLEFITSDKNLKTQKDDSFVFFSNLSQISQSEANSIISSVKYVSEETCDNLFNAGLQCVSMLKSKNMTASDMKPDMLTYDMFMVLTESYWMVEKDLDWYHSISAKTLNKTNEYIIGSFTVVEYRSNQVVKFNNPYMHGRKNSMIFVMKRGNQIFGIYASIYTLEKIAHMLAELTYMPDGYKEKAPKLMTNANNIDEINPKYFYHFYEVLQTSGGWDLQKSYGGFVSAFLYCMKSSYHLSMYKPTGVFYLTMDTYVIQETKDPKTGKKIESALNKVTYPIFPIGDMDRALMVADTTNTNNRYARFKEELVQLAIYEKAKRVGKAYTPSREFPDIDPTNYYKVRQMSIDGIQETFEYSKYVDDRAAFMIGRVHTGELKVNGMGDAQAEFEDFDTEDEDYSFEDYEDDYEETDDIEISDDDFADFDDEDDEYFEDFDDEDY